MVESPTKLVFPTSFNTTYIEDDSNSDKLVFRAALKTKEDVLLWMEEYKILTRTDWVVKNPKDNMT
jgi:hypothetical protein